MAFDRSMLLTYLAVALVVVTGVVVSVNGDLTSEPADDGILTIKEKIEVGDFIEFKEISIELGETVVETVRYKVVSISEGERFPVNVVEIRNGEIIGFFDVAAWGFKDIIYTNGDREFDSAPVATEEVETEFGMVLCDVYALDDYLGGAVLDAHIGAGSCVRYYVHSSFEDEAGKYEFTQILAATNILV